LDSWWSDDGFLNRIDDEFNRLHSFNGNANGHLVEMNTCGSGKMDKKMKKLAEANGDPLKRNMEQLLDENRKLKGEIQQWKAMHASLYKFASSKAVDDDDDIPMFQ